MTACSYLRDTKGIKSEDKDDVIVYSGEKEAAAAATAAFCFLEASCNGSVVSLCSFYLKSPCDNYALTQGFLENILI